MIRFHETAAAVIFGLFGDFAQRGGAFMWFFVICAGLIAVFLILRPDAYAYFVAYTVSAATWAYRHSPDYQGPGLFWALGIGVLGIWLIVADYRKFIR